MFQRSGVFLLLGAMLVLLWVVPSHAQNTGTIQGRVTDQRTERPLPGAQVFVEGRGIGTLTDQDGRYQLVNVPAGDQTVRAQLIGYGSTQQMASVTAGQAVTLNLTLAQRAVELDEVVVTGQGAEISRRRLSTNIDVISAEAIQASPATRLDQLLQSSLPSVQVRIASGQPGTTSVMRGRGPVSVSRSTTPVIYVDGVRVDNLNTQAELSLNTSGQASSGTQTSSIADIPLENIQRIEYVPGGAATTLYGSDAANGVIQIFTNRGAPGPTNLSIESELGVETPNRKNFYFPQTADLLYRNGLTQQYRLSASGGGENATWSFGGSAHDREGFRIANNASRNYQTRMGLSGHLTSHLRYNGTASFGWNEYERSRDGNAGGYAPIWLLEGGRIFALGFNNRLNEASAEELADLRAFLTRAEELQNFRVEVSRFQTSQGVRWEPRSDLTFNGLVGLDHRTSNERGIMTNEFLVHTRIFPEGTDDRGSIDSYDRRFLGLTLEGGGQHRLDRGVLSLVTSFGTQLFRNQDEQSARTALNVRDGSETVRGAGITSADDVFRTVVNYGIYAQQNWGFLDRYFVEVGLRADGNSAFGDEVGLQYYPKVGFAYDLSAEPFFQNAVRPAWISNLRLRGNYGVAGNFPPPFAHDRTVSFASYLGRQSVAFGQPGNPELRPEKTHTVEIGADMGALAGRMNLQFNWYNARTRDALFLAPSAPSTGEGLQLRNVGEILNRGMEFRMAVDVVQTANLNLRLSGALNTLHNEVVDVGGSPVFAIAGHSAGTIQSVVQEGLPVGTLRGNKATFAPNGTIESVTPQAVLGNPLPDRFGTLGMEASVGRYLRLNTDADWQTGAQMHSFNRQFRYLHGLDDPGIPQALLDANRAANWLRITNLFVEDTDYLIIRNLSARYTVPETLTPGWAPWARGVELGFSILNPIGWWSSSFNPETDYSGAQGQDAAFVGGFNYGADPTPRTFLGTIRVRF